MVSRFVTTTFVLLATASYPLQSKAGVYGDSLGKCLVSTSTDQDKQQLVEWMFSAISLNPSVSSYVDLPAEKREEIDRRMAALFEKLVGETCRKEASDALKYEGANAFGAAFQLFGRVAGEQIFAAPEVSKGAEAFYKYLDSDGLQKKLGLPASKP